MTDTVKLVEGRHPQRVGLEEIDTGPGPYCMSFGFDPTPLESSIQKVGLLNPPVLIKEGGGPPVVVAGYRRLQALRSLGRNQAPCRVFDRGELRPLQGLQLGLYDNLATRSFNDVEKGMVLNRLAPHVSRDRLLREYMPLLNLPSHESTLDLYLSLDALDPALRTALAAERISLRALKLLLDLAPESRSVLCAGILSLKLNANQQQRFIEHSVDISLRDDMEIPRLFAEGPLREAMEEGDSNIPQKGKRVLSLLRSMRFPVLSRSEKAFRKKVGALSLPAGVRVQVPPFFEGSGYTLEIDFKDGETLKRKIHALSREKDLAGLGDPWSED